MQAKIFLLSREAIGLQGVLMSSPKKGITVRFEDHEMQQLDDLAERYQVTSATIIRWSLRALAEYVRMNDGRIVLPLDFSRLPNGGRPPLGESEGGVGK
jgi:hypothetical protein